MKHIFNPEEYRDMTWYKLILVSPDQLKEIQLLSNLVIDSNNNYDMVHKYIVLHHHTLVCIVSHFKQAVKQYNKL